MRSVRRSLLVALLGAVAAVTLAASILVYRLARAEIDDVFDYNLRQIALSLRDQVRGGGGVVGLPAEGFDFVIQIWDRDGTRLYLSREGSGLPESARLGLTTVAAATGEWRVYSAELGDLVVQVAQPMEVRQRLAVAAALRTLAPVLLMLPLLAFLVWRTVGAALAPLERLARAVGTRTPAALERIPEADAPEEALPLVRSLNELLGRLGAALAAQRAFVADAAHELRTPLAALGLQLQLVERAADPAERTAALAELRAGVERTTRLAQQLLALARAEPDAPAPAGEPVRLDALAAQAVADHAVVAEARRVDLGVARTSDDAAVRGDPAALRTLLANLVENAVRHAREGGRVDVSAGVAEGGPWLEVADDGPGIPPEERGRVFDRFYRGPDARGPGSGLGLAIVKAVAGRHGATVTLGDTPGGGLTVRVAFPASRAARADGAAPAAAPHGAAAP